MSLGSIIGFVVPVFIVHVEDEENPNVGRQHVTEYMYIQAGIATVTCTLLLILAKNKPPTPPSIAAGKPVVKFDFKEQFLVLAKNRNYVLLCVVFGCLYANTGALSAVISSITKPYDFEPKDNSIMGSIFIISGIFGSFTGGLLLDKFSKFKISVIIVSFIGMIFYGLLMISIPSGKLIFAAINFGLIGFFVVPILPICFTFAVELSYPAPEAMSNGMMLLISKIYGAVLGIGAGKLSEKNPYYSIGLFVMNAVIAAIFSFLVKEDLRRLKMTH